MKNNTLHIKISLFLFISLATFLFSCGITETQSEARKFSLKLLDCSTDDIKLILHKGAGKYEECKTEDKIHFNIEIPAMRGGYSEFLFFIKFNEHNPEEYKVLRIMKKGEILKELSIRDIEQLPQDVQNNYKLKTAE